jgi:hypothetical protein
MEFDPYEFKVLALMIRKNLGYQNPHKKFSLRYIQKLTSMSRPTIISALIGLEDKGSIEKISKGAEIGRWEIKWSKPLIQTIWLCGMTTMTFLLLLMIYSEFV